VAPAIFCSVLVTLPLTHRAAQLPAGKNLLDFFFDREFYFDPLAKLPKEDFLFFMLSLCPTVRPLLTATHQSHIPSLCKLVYHVSITYLNNRDPIFGPLRESHHPKNKPFQAG
jgi:hypothetical protein